MKQRKTDYDAIIIGAGIGGLVCGCYLAKAGLKTLIVEKNHQPGGYCTSFKRKGFTFDACVHSLGNLKEPGALGKILKELDINKDLLIKRSELIDVIFTPEGKISFWSDMEKTVTGFESAFPKENIRKFFQYLNQDQDFSFVRLRKITFYELLNEFFFGEKIKAIFSLLVLGNLGLPASQISAFTAVKFYKEFVIHGGYYPNTEIQTFPNVIAGKFKKLGGKLILGDEVEKIKVKDMNAVGIFTKKKLFYSGDVIISNSDAVHTLKTLIGSRYLFSEKMKEVMNLESALSMLVLYIGISKRNDSFFKSGVNYWYLPHYDVDKMYANACHRTLENMDWFMARFMPDGKSMLMFVNTVFRSQKYWTNNKKKYIKEMISRISSMMPGIHENIIYEDAATPQTLHKWTNNYKGSSYGWASVPCQFAAFNMSKIVKIGKIFMTGHWTTLAQGVPGVAYLGRDTARIIINQNKKRYS